MTHFLDTLPFNFSRQSVQELLASCPTATTSKVRCADWSRRRASSRRRSLGPSR